MGGQQHQTRRLLFGLPDSLRRLDTQLLGGLILGEDDAVAGGGIAADSHRQKLQLRMAQKLHRGKKAVQIAVQNHPLRHGDSLLSFICSIIPRLGAAEKGKVKFIEIR